MKVSECMTWDVLIADPDHTIGEAAKAMLDVDIGVLPVGENDRLGGVVTDRDIAVRRIAEGLGPYVRLPEVMCPRVGYISWDSQNDATLHTSSHVYNLSLTY